MHANSSPLVWLSLSLLSALVTSACGETRTLDLFPKKAAPTPLPLPPPGAACGASAMCPAERSVCSAAQCVQCAEDSDCGGALRACVANTCVECAANEHCPMKKVCDLGIQRCTEPCTATEPCNDKNRAVCDVNRAWCVQCLQDADCDAKHVCDTTRSECVGCMSNTDCGDAGACDVERSECTTTHP